MDVTVWGRSFRVTGGPYAVWAYRKEFGTDLPLDLAASHSDGEVQVSIWMQVLWAMERTADGHTPGYGEWLRAFPEFDVTDQRSVDEIDRAIKAGFTVAERPQEASGGEGEERDRWETFRTIAVAKLLGFSMDELRLLDMADWVAITDCMDELRSAGGRRKGRARKATQADIDAFLGA